MRKSFTRLLGVFILFCMMALQAVAQPGVAKDGLKPADGACQVARQGVFVITFTEDVSPGYDGTISLNNASGTEYVPIQLRSTFEKTGEPGVFIAPSGAKYPWTVTFSGKTVTIDFGYKLGEYSKFFIAVSPNAVKSKANPTKYFAGIAGGTLVNGKCQSETTGWDFTTEDNVAPTVDKLEPKNGETNVSINTCTVTFKENVYWVNGIFPYAGYAGANASLKTGDIAIYESTDVGIEGGDVVYDKPVSAVITGNKLVITWSSLPSSSDLYVRIKPGIIEDERGNDFAGLKTNDTWNFTTKDKTVPKVAFSMSGCANDANFIIELNETGIVEAITRKALTNDILKGAVEIKLNGVKQELNAVTPSVDLVLGKTKITIDPKKSLENGASYEVILLDKKLWDSSDNNIGAASKTLTAGDYVGATPNLTDAFKNPEGTSFNIKLTSNEDATYYYIVVKADSIKKGDNKYAYQPEVFDSTILSVIKAYGTTPGTLGIKYKWEGDKKSTKDDKYIDVYAAGDIIAPAGTELLERVTKLPASDGTDWVVLMFAADKSLCGNNQIKEITPKYLSSTCNVSGPFYVEGATYDIKPPVATITAELINAKYTDSGCGLKPVGTTPGTTTGEFGVSKWGPVYITFNEDVADNDGTDFTGAEIKGAVTLTDGKGVVDIDASKTKYNADKKRFEIHPSRPFESASSLNVVLLGNQLQDKKDLDRFGANGTTLLTSSSASFCTESYRGPILTAIPCKTATEPVKRNAEIVLSIKDPVYALGIDGGGNISTIAEDRTFIGRYLKIRKHVAGKPNATTLSSGVIIYNNNTDLLKNVNLTATYESDPKKGDSLVIKITPKDNFKWDSETWYSIEVEQNLVSKDDKTLVWEKTSTEGNACVNDNYWTAFLSEDSVDPSVKFYTASSTTSGSTGDLCGATVSANTYIYVSFSEGVKVGFANNKSKPETFDPNALRRYFKLEDVTNAEKITSKPFDCKNITFDASGYITSFYIDPYDTVETNFAIGRNYQISYVSTVNENNAWADYSKNDALVDKNGNPLPASTKPCGFNYPKASPGTTCLASAYLEGVQIDLASASIPVNSDSIVNLTLNFGTVMNNPSQWTTGYIEIIDTLNGSVQTAPLNTGTLGNGGTAVNFIFDMHRSKQIATNPRWGANNAYWIQFTPINGMNNLPSSGNCTYPSTAIPFKAILTKDNTAPVITAMIPHDIPGPIDKETVAEIIYHPSTTNLLDLDTTDIIIVFDENVKLQKGKLLEIWRKTTGSSNTRICAIDASLGNDSRGDTIVFARNLFASYLAYNSAYYINIPEGFVKNDAGIANVEVKDETTYTFGTGSNPPPTFMCGKFSPYYELTGGVEIGKYENSVTPILVIEFSEDVDPVANKYVQIVITSETSASPIKLSVAADQFKSSGTKSIYKLTTKDGIINQADGKTFDGFKWNGSYAVNIEDGAFQELNGSGTTPALVTPSAALTYPENDASCNWTFSIGDKTAPKIAFWPKDKAVHVATTSYLYAYIDEKPTRKDGEDLTSQNLSGYFTLTRGTTPVDFDVEFVGSTIQDVENQQKIRIVPRDVDGSAWSLTDNTRSLKDSTLYKLSFVNAASGSNAELMDANSNVIKNFSVEFMTEDISNPAFDVAPTVDGTKTTGKSITVTGSLDEPGTIRYLVVAHDGSYPKETAYNNVIWGKDYKTLGIAAGEAATDKTPFDFTFTVQLDRDQTTGYEVDIIVYAQDKESDIYAKEEDILKQEPYKAPWSIETELYRIKDIRPSPNGTIISSVIPGKFCDNDVPTLTEQYPSRDTINMSFPVADSIMLVFNEDITLTDDITTSSRIVLRDADNNLGIPLAYDISRGDTLVLYPLDSTKVSTAADALMPIAAAKALGYKKALADQKRYYLEIDRFAIKDVSTCSANYFNEWVGKGNMLFLTEDKTSPSLVSWSPGPCAFEEDSIKITFKDPNGVKPNPKATALEAFVRIFKVNKGTGALDIHENIPVQSSTFATNAKGEIVVTIPTSYALLSDSTYKVEVSANAYIDNYNNGTLPLTWFFTVSDHQAPNATLSIVEDLTYLGIVYGDPDYKPSAPITLNEGEGKTGIATTSVLKVQFDEPVYLKNVSGSDKDDKYYAITNIKVRDELIAAITIKNKTDNKDLYFVANSAKVFSAKDSVCVFRTVGADNFVIEIYQARDHWTPKLAPAFSDSLGLRSNTEYEISLKDLFYDDVDACSKASNQYNGTYKPWTIGTRDDTPPTLTITDSKGDTICGKKCVSELAPLRLSFSVPVVKTPQDFSQVAWWTHANLPLTEADLLNTSSGDFLNIFDLGTSDKSVAGPAVKLSKAVVNANGKDIDIYPSAPLLSEHYYKIVFKAGSVKDTIRIPKGNEFLGSECIFRVKDTQNPKALAFYPANDADGVDNQLNTGTTTIKYTNNTTTRNVDVTVGKDSIAIYFNEQIAVGKDSLIIYSLNGKVYKRIGASQCKVDEKNDSVLVIPVNELDKFTTYYVEVPQGFVTDYDAMKCVANPNDAIDPEKATDPANDKFQWSFKTADSDAPIAKGYSPTGINAPRNSELSITFDENINVSASTDCELYIYQKADIDNPGEDFGNIVEVIEFNIGGKPNYELSGANLLDENVISFKPVNPFTSNGQYYIRVDGNCISDKNISTPQFWVGVHDSTSWAFTVTNDAKPKLASKDPKYNHIGAEKWVYDTLAANDKGYVIADLSMTFDDGNKNPINVAANIKDGGMIRIYEYHYDPATSLESQILWDSLDINDESVIFDGTNKVTIKGVTLRDCINKKTGSPDYAECYYVLIEQRAIVNANPGSTSYFDGILNPFVWRFQTGCDDTFVCESEIVSPNKVDGTEQGLNLTIEEASTLVVKFGEPIQATGGKIQLSYLDASGTLVTENITVVDTMCEGNTLTVDISKFMLDETDYTVNVLPNAIGDKSNGSTGIPGDCVGTWKFQTGDNTNPLPDSVSLSFNGQECVEATPILTMLFKESKGVVLKEGTIKIYNNTLGKDIAEVPMENVAVDSVNINKVTISLPEGIILPDTTVIKVTVPAGFLADGDVSPLENEEFSWTFKTGDNTAPTVKAITPEMAVTADTVLTIEFSEFVNIVKGKKITINEVPVLVDSLATLDSITYTYPLKALVSEATYAVVIEEGAFVDVNEGCSTSNMIDSTELSFQVDDISAPIATGSPTSAPDYLGLEIFINFDDAVKPATGNVVIYDKDNDSIVETISADKFTAASGDSIYTYAPKKLGFGEYYILIDEGAFVDATAAEVGKKCIQDTAGWTLSIYDGEFLPCANLISPQRAEKGVTLDTKIVIDFCDERIIKAGTSKDAFLTVADQWDGPREEGEGIHYFYYLIADSMINGNKLEVSVSGLQENTTYSITVATGAVIDEAGNEFAGVTDANQWIFTTGDFSKPVVSVVADTLFNIAGNTVEITSNELGTVYLAEEGVPANTAALLSAISQKKAVAATVVTAGTAVSVSVEGLEPGTYKAYGFDISGVDFGVATNVVLIEEVPVMDFTAISAIQGSADASPLDGQKIRTKGVVTAIDKNGFYIQDAVAAWSGVYVYSTQFVGDVNIGGSFELIGTVDEYNGLTEIVSVETLVPIAKLLTVTPIEVAATEAVAEKYESVLVKVIGRATSSYAGSADWAVKTDKNITIAVSNYIYGTYSSILDHKYAVIGVVYQRNADYKVEPRMEGDITDLSVLNGVDNNALSMKVYPNPFDKYISLNVSNDVKITKAVITNIAGQLVKEIINPNNTISTSELRSGVYFISLHTEDGVAKTERIIKR